MLVGASQSKSWNIFKRQAPLELASQGCENVSLIWAVNCIFSRITRALFLQPPFRCVLYLRTRLRRNLWRSGVRRRFVFSVFRVGAGGIDPEDDSGTERSLS